MKLVVDKYVPLPDEQLTSYAEVVRLEPEDITADAVRDADALIIRTRTFVNGALLDGSKVQFVATATIGYDHIDTAYCEQHHITWTACPGCNAHAVAEYMRAVLDHTATKTTTLGVVGVGHIGSLVSGLAQGRGMRVLLNDPPKGIGVPLDTIAAECDIITFHVPLTFAPTPYPTYHLCDAAFLHKCKPNALIINAARGGIVDEQALLQSGHPCVIDCWESEPHINRDLLLSPNTLLASYHIAGYSLEGKINASLMCLNALGKHFGIRELANLKPETFKPETFKPESLGDSAPGWLQRVSTQLKAHPEQFEQLRKQYKLR